MFYISFESQNKRRSDLTEKSKWAPFTCPGMGVTLITITQRSLNNEADFPFTKQGEDRIQGDQSTNHSLDSNKNPHHSQMKTTTTKISNHYWACKLLNSNQMWQSESSARTASLLIRLLKRFSQGSTNSIFRTKGSNASQQSLTGSWGSPACMSCFSIVLTGILPGINHMHWRDKELGAKNPRRKQNNEVARVPCSLWFTLLQARGCQRWAPFSREESATAKSMGIIVTLRNTTHLGVLFLHFVTLSHTHPPKPALHFITRL